MTSEKSSIKAKSLLFNPNKQYCFSAEKWPLNLTEIRISIIFFLIRCLFILQVLSCTKCSSKLSGKSKSSNFGPILLANLKWTS